MRPLNEQQFNQLYAALSARADRLGRTSVKITPPQRTVRKVTITVTIPGQDDEPRLPDEVMFRYEEWFRRTPVGWVRVRYNYNYFDLRTGGRWGLHLHPVTSRGTRSPEPHRVCVWPDGRGKGKHYAAHEVELVAAHEAFEEHYAAGRPVACTGLTQLDRVGSESTG